jgi:hypothetical protein
VSHLVDEASGELRFEVKWEGYDKKSDMTWEPEENLLCTQPCGPYCLANVKLIGRPLLRS